MTPDRWSRWSRWYGLQIPLELRPVRALLEMLDVRQSEALLDLGTGTGVVLRELARSAQPPETAVGVDRSAEMLARIPDLPSAWRPLEADAASLPFDDDSFDVVTASYLLHLLDREEPARVIAEAIRVLAPDGRLGTVTVAPPAGGISSFATWPIRALARRSGGLLAGLRPLDPGQELLAAGLGPVRGRRVSTGYPSLCVIGESFPRRAGSDG